jgi:hypothetical protein
MLGRRDDVDAEPLGEGDRFAQMVERRLRTVALPVRFRQRDESSERQTFVTRVAGYCVESLLSEVRGTVGFTERHRHDGSEAVAMRRGSVTACGAVLCGGPRKKLDGIVELASLEGLIGLGDQILCAHQSLACVTT